MRLYEFAPEGFEQYTLYVGDALSRHKIQTFATLDDAIDEAKFLMDTDPRTVLDYWLVTDSRDVVVWQHDPGEIADQMRRGKKIQFQKPDDLQEGIDYEHSPLVKDFIRWAYKKLRINAPLPTIIFSDEKDSPDMHHTGWYKKDTDTMWVYTHNRNLIDILRTVAHELTHRRQDVQGRIKVHSPPGSKLEREADEQAGILMKLYGKMHPEIIQ